MRSADDVLTTMWRNLRNGASPREIHFVAGAISALEFVGLLTAEQGELWRFRINTCPGHDDEGGRDWCAYGCEMEPKP